jgi:hypothetical protein
MTITIVLKSRRLCEIAISRRLFWNILTMNFAIRALRIMVFVLPGTLPEAFHLTNLHKRGYGRNDCGTLAYHAWGVLTGTPESQQKLRAGY